jgi:hypothetical protein
MIVKTVKKISRESDDAIVVLSDGVFECKCFCQPCHLAVGQVVEGRLFALNASNLYSSARQIQLFEPRDLFAYRVVGELRSLKPAIVGVGAIEIELDAGPPGDWRVGEAVEFECDRLDVIS